MGAPPLIGRREELAWLEPRLDAALAGEPRVILLSGEPGVGKSMLVRHLQRAGQARGFEVLAGRCREHLDLPYLPFTGALLPRLARFAGEEGATIGRLLGRTSPAADAPAHADTALFATVARTAIALAEQRPLLVVVDDLQWVDRASLDLFTHLAVEVADAALGRAVAMVLVAGYRPQAGGRVASELARLRREEICDDLALTGLGEPEVAELLRALGIARPSRRLEADVHRATGGNPLFVENLVYGLRRPGALLERGGELFAAAELDAAGPPEVTDAIRERLRAEPDAVRTVMRVLACFGRPADLDEVAAGGDSERDAVSKHLGAAVDDGLLVADDEGYQFAHPLYDRVTYAECDVAVRRRLHRQIAEALRARGSGRAVELAHHLVAAGADPPSQDILERARDAGNEARAMLAWGEAARWYEVAAEAATRLGHADAALADLRFSAGVAHHRNMDVASSREPLVRAADHFRSAGDLGGEARALMELVQAQLAIAALGEPVDVTRLEQVLEGLAATDDGLYAHGVAQLAEAYWVGGDADRAATTAQRALDLGRRAEHAGACALAQITLSTIAWMQLDLRDALATLEGALEDARAHDDPWYEGVVLPRIALTHLWLGQLDEAAATAQAASDKASWIGDRAEQTFALAAAVGVEAARGNYPAAETAAADAWLALRLSRYAWGASFFLPVLADVRSRLGSTDAAERALDQWTGLESGPATLVEEPAWALRQLVRARAGFAVGAALESDAARLDARWPVTLGTVARFATLAELAERTDAPVDLARIERALERALARGMVLTEGPVFLVARVHALVTWLLGHVEEADARYRTAIETAERLEMSPELARACGEHARVLDSLGQHEAARAAADRAAALEAQIGRSDGAGDTGREGEVVIMFTDVVDSTRLTEALGDAAYRGRADALDLRLRTVVRERGGRPEEGITLGDGIVALFASGRGAIECAVHAHALARENGLELRVGLHAGDVSRSASGIYGGAVNLTARVCDLADARETLASETVRGLARTSADVGFLDRGLHELKGITEPVHLYAVTAH